MREKLWAYFGGIDDLESGFGFLSHNDIWEHESVLIFSIHSTEGVLKKKVYSTMHTFLEINRAIE